MRYKVCFFCDMLIKKVECIRRFKMPDGTTRVCCPECYRESLDYKPR